MQKPTLHETDEALALLILAAITNPVLEMNGTKVGGNSRLSFFNVSGPCFQISSRYPHANDHSIQPCRFSSSSSFAWGYRLEIWKHGPETLKKL
ncbi:MAG: hypothetical protein AAFO17_11215, partial [Pseudomonadota bacterium]